MPGDHDGQTRAARLEQLLERMDCGFGVECVENRLYENQIHTAVDQCGRSFGVGRGKLVERDVACTGIANVRRQRACAVCRAEHSGDEARYTGGGTYFVGNFSRQARGRGVELADEIGQVIVGLRRRVRVERIRADDVGACFEKAAVNSSDVFRLCNDEQIVVALERLWPIRKTLPAKSCLIQAQVLDTRAHRAVEHGDSRADQCIELRVWVRQHPSLLQARSRARRKHRA